MAEESFHDSDSVSDTTSLRRTLKEVSIPVMAPSVKRKLSGGPAAASALSVSSVEDTPAEYDTPATSIAVTPEASLSGKTKISKRKRSRLSDELPAEETMDVDNDFEIAQALQEEEYTRDDRENKRVKRGSYAFAPKRKQILDSDAEEGAEELGSDTDDLSSVASINESEVSLPLRRSRIGKGTTSAPFSVPQTDDEESYEVGLSKARAGKKPQARKAGKAARASIGQALASVVIDSEESDLSDFIEIDSQDEYSEEEVSVHGDEIYTDDDEPLANRRLKGLVAADAISITSGTVTSGVATPATAAKRRKARRNNNSLDEVVPSGMSSRKFRERKRLEKAHPNIKTMWADLEAIPKIIPIPAAQPASINRKLKSFQLEGLDWMVRQEKSQYRGGLLGDEMGMGKTIQAVSLIMSDYPAKDPTLVVVPPVALMQWSNEIAEYTDGKLKVLVYHGQNSKVKGMSIKELKKYDVIMASYNGLESLYRKETKGWSRGEDIVKEDSPLHAIHYHRLILDEAHSIKQRTTGVARACFALKGNYKWCLSGTPVQNRIGEFFSLLRFLEVRPFADYFCKRCPCSLLHWSLNDEHRCHECGHAGMEHVSVFNQELLNPITQSDDPRERSRAMDKLHLITSRIMLRRVKRDHTSSMELPPKEVIIHNEFFGEIERDFSSSIMSNTSRQFDTYVSRGVMLNNYANIFGLIMQMRQVANHPDLLLKKHAHEGQNVLVCNICDEPAEEAIRSKCRHDFCRSCVKNFVQSVEASGGEPDCPRCHIPLSIDFDQPEIEQDEDVVKKSSIINRIKMENWTSSTKIEMLVYDLYKLRSKKQTLKSIVFSQFTSMLQLIEWRLRRAGFNTVMLDGSMTPIQRQKSIEHFMTNPDVEVFLVSLKAGGVALNLTEASRVFIVDP